MSAYHQFWPAFAVLLFATGCGLDGPAPSETKPTPPAPQTAAKPSQDAKHADATPAGRPSRNVTETKPAVASAAEARPGTVREAAHVGMGEKGRGYGKGYLAVTLGAYWSVQEMLALDRIKHDMQIYKAAEGNYPKNMDEFMEKIIKPANIKLPLLPAGRRYVYDPNSEDYLMIEAPEMDSGESSNGH
jgi:hypothetical protein